MNGSQLALKIEQLLGREQLVGRRGRMAMQLEHGHLAVIVRITHLYFQEKAIQLRLGEAVNAFLLDWVLGGQHHERLRQRQRRALYCHLIFLHGFEQGGLRFGGGAVDLIGQQDLAEDRPLAQNKLAGFAVENIGAGHIGRQQVGSELQPLIVNTQDMGEDLRKRRFGNAGHAF